MTTKVAPTEEEVLAALEKATLRGDRGWSAANRVDVAEAVARLRGWNGTDGFDRSPSGQNPSRASVIGQWVSIKAVQDILDHLDRLDRVCAIYGNHPFIAGGYGIVPKVVYYLSQEALVRILGGQRNHWLERAAARALEAAEEQVLLEHAEDVEKYRQVHLAAELKAEPDWQHILNHSGEEKD